VTRRGNLVRRLAIAGCLIVASLGVGADGAEELDLSGDWVADTSCDPTACGMRVWSTEETIRLRQRGSQVTILADSVGKIKAEFAGGFVTWSRTYSEEGGKTVETGTVQISEDGESFDGGSRWYWTDGQNSCRGTCSYSGERKPELEKKKKKKKKNAS